MERFVRQTWAMVRKDLRREIRTGEVIITSIAFSVLLTVIFAFAFFHDDQTVGIVFPGILWVAVVFGGMLVVSRTFDQETETGCLRALALVPGSAQSVYAAKMLVNLTFMAIFEAVLLPLCALAFDVSILPTLGTHVAVLAAGTLGFTALGTLTSAMLVEDRLRQVLLPIVLYPLAVPLLIAGVKATGAMVGTEASGSPWAWIRVMLAMDVVFVLAGSYLFGWVFEAVE
jgi:heme exporter protein B